MKGYDEYMEAEQNAPLWFIILVWLGWVTVTIAGYLAGKWLTEAIASSITGETVARRVLSIEGRVEAAGAVSYVVALLGGACAGATLGFMQGVFLIPFLKMAGAVEWLLATTIGRTVQWIVISAIGLEMAGLTVDKSLAGVLLLFASLGVTGILSGVALGYPQSLVFKRRSGRARGWMVASMIGPVTTSLLIAATLGIEARNTIRDGTTLLTAILTALATGFALVEIFRHPRTGAEWGGILAWRRGGRAMRTGDETVLGSSLYSARPESRAKKEASGTESGAESSSRVP